MNQDTYQYYFESMPENSIFMEYIIFPLIIFLIILLIYQFIKKRIMKDDKDELFQSGKYILKFEIKIKGKIIK